MNRLPVLLFATTLAAAASPATAGIDPLRPFLTTTVEGGVEVSATCINHADRAVGGPNGADLVVSGIPPGATVERALLYWSVLAETSPVGTLSPTLDGVPLAPEPLGEIRESPCFPFLFDTGTFRADVTPLVGGNGTFRLGGFPGNVVTFRDLTEGATLVVAWSRPGSATSATLILSDGVDVTSVTPDDSDVVSQRFSGFVVPTGARVRLVAAIGNGQSFAPDSIALDGTNLAARDPALLQGSLCLPDGLYDLVDVDVTDLLPPGSTSATLDLLALSDCYSIAAAGLVIETCSSIEPSALDLRAGATPLRVSKGADATTLHVTWEDVGAIYEVWRGTIGVWYRHSPLACDVRATSADVPFEPGDLYYLVAGCGGGASAGRDSFGIERPTAEEASGIGCR